MNFQLDLSETQRTGSEPPRWLTQARAAQPEPCAAFWPETSPALASEPAYTEAARQPGTMPILGRDLIETSRGAASSEREKYGRFDREPAAVPVAPSEPPAKRVGLSLHGREVSYRDFAEAMGETEAPRLPDDLVAKPFGMMTRRRDRERQMQLDLVEAERFKARAEAELPPQERLRRARSNRQLSRQASTSSISGMPRVPSLPRYLHESPAHSEMYVPTVNSPMASPVRSQGSDEHELMFDIDGA